MNRTAYATSLVAGAALLAATGAAHAQVACSSLPNPVVLSGSTAIKPLIQELAPRLRTATGEDQMTVVMRSSGSCAGVAALAADITPTGACASGACVTGTANYWDATGTQQTCNLDAAGTHVDVALSDVFSESCAGVDRSRLQETQTVVIPFAFIVPLASMQTAIDVREAYFAYGFGPSGMVSPWDNESFLFRRDALSGTQITIARAIGVPETRFFGVDTGGTSGMLMRVATASNPEAALGFAGTDSTDSRRDTVTALAYRHWGQNNYYWPDSRRDSFDKRNVRDGHYPLWGYEQAVVLLDGAGRPVSARAQRFADILANRRAVPSVNVTALTVAANLVPMCAMEVSRTIDGGDFSLYEPAEPCGCFFDATVPMGSTSCTACTSDAACGAGGHCRHGYCESR
jgi:hypothetical protein